ncbi:polygalacturonase PglA [Rhizobium oryzicola]|uniref:Glycoside hydrolase family 28 protein n=1 Tax=Rhizobium oryzicola TaxID=1232668 RepID=A0ABT8T309_9HYPH|nr:glycoside hydrolase family 28 protein [Rhizobium oryzicola]MDO1584945.1 glycoside hydrolase family 28 protein [Rhizobium oryzicola]
MSTLTLLAATSRTATFRLDADANQYFLPGSRSWRLLDGDGNSCGEGRTDKVVFTLVGLQPQKNYRIALEDATICEFKTLAESALIDITAAGASLDAEDNTAFIQQAIDTLPAGGTLKVPAGTFLTGPLFLKSHMTLLLEDGACLKGLIDRDRYPILAARHEDGRVLGTWEGVCEPCYASLITALDCEDLAITGAGIIDGGADGGDWWTWPKETRNGARRPRTVFLSHNRGVLLTGVTVRNSPSWTVHPVLSRDVVVADLKIENDPYSPNTDGLNPECCRNVLLTGIFFSVGDDCIAIKAGKRDPKGGLDQPCEGIAIENCRMERGHGGVVIGSEMSGSVRNVSVRRCSLSETDRGLRVKTRRGRGGAVENITVEDCVMERVAVPLVINSFYFCDADGRSDYVQSRSPYPVSDTTPIIRGITIRNVVADNVAVSAAALYGLPEAPIEDVTIENYRVSFDPDAVGDVPDMALYFEPLRHAGIVTQNTQLSHEADLTVVSPQQSTAV